MRFYHRTPSAPPAITYRTPGEETVVSDHLQVRDIWLSFGGIQALSNISFDVRRREILAIIGPNGAGKTSLLNCLNNFYRPDRGRILFEGQDLTLLSPHRIAPLGIARTFQHTALYTGLSTLDNLMAARHIHMRSGFWHSLLYRGAARREDGRLTARWWKRSLTFWRSSIFAKRLWALCPMDCASEWNWAGRWRWSRNCCCWTSP